MASLNKRLCVEASEPKSQKRYYPDLFKELQAIDYSQPIEDPLSLFQIDRTFTWLDWKETEMNEHTQRVFAELPLDQQIRMMFSVFP